MGAITVSAVTHGVSDNKKVTRATLTFSASYATSGDTLSANKLSLRQVDDLVVDSGLQADGVTAIGTPSGYAFKLGGTASAPKVLVYNSSGQIANATDLSTVTVGVRVYGSA